jgi:Hint domain
VLPQPMRDRQRIDFDALRPIGLVTMPMELAMVEATHQNVNSLLPDHAVLVDGALIQAGALVNGTSIIRETNVQPIFTYYHVEVDDHSLILAENTLAETFVDKLDRLAFNNWAEHQAL